MRKVVLRQTRPLPSHGRNAGAPGMRECGEGGGGGGGGGVARGRHQPGEVGGCSLGGGAHGRQGEGSCSVAGSGAACVPASPHLLPSTAIVRPGRQSTLPFPPHPHPPATPTPVPHTGSTPWSAPPAFLRACARWARAGCPLASSLSTTVSRWRMCTVVISIMDNDTDLGLILSSASTKVRR